MHPPALPDECRVPTLGGVKYVRRSVDCPLISATNSSVTDDPNHPADALLVYASVIGESKKSAVMTAADLKSRTVKDLASMAKRRKVPGWHAMKKDQLVKALLRHARSEAGRRLKSNGTSSPDRNVKSRHHLELIKTKLAESKDLSFRMIEGEHGTTQDRLIVMVRDPVLAPCLLGIEPQERRTGEGGLGQHWHHARPVLRVSEVLRDGATTFMRQTVRDVEVHGGVNNWYIDVHHPPKSYQLDIGYLTPDGRFFSLARSNVVTTPATTAGDAFDRNWAEVAKEFDRVFVLSGGYSEPEANGELREVIEERLHRPITDPVAAHFGPGANGASRKHSQFDFHVDTELIVHGATHPDARVTLRGEPVKLRSDGTFAVRFNLPDRRHVLPVVASSRDGAEQRTIVLAVDRNTKVMEPVVRDSAEES